MKGYLLDSSICIALFRGNRDVAAMLNKVGCDQCFISPIVMAELLYGAYRSDHVDENLKQTYDFANKVHVLPFEDCLETFARERARLWKAGKRIEDFDLLIGRAAKAAGLVMVTHNVDHFAHIDGIEIEDWVQ